MYAPVALWDSKNVVVTSSNDRPKYLINYNCHFFSNFIGLKENVNKILLVSLRIWNNKILWMTIVLNPSMKLYVINPNT